MTRCECARLVCLVLLIGLGFAVEAHVQTGADPATTKGASFTIPAPAPVQERLL